MAPGNSITQAIADLRRRRDAIDRALTALEAVEQVDAPSRVTFENDNMDPSRRRQRRKRGQGPGGSAGAARVLTSRPGEGFTDSELAEAMVANGWDTSGTEHPAMAARAAANRLRRDDPDNYVLESGRFFYRPQGQSELTVSMNGDAAETDQAEDTAGFQTR